ncbi:hypothetical protein BBJ28_00005024 [Nothophytophthora sp. Chile5]|nr:hypothetical protein BBJ28_00005024 [Nothophytophthora sp. Chile5]
MTRGSESVTPVNGLAFTRRYEESNQIAFVMAQQLLLPTLVLQFGMHCWTGVTRSEDEPLQSITRTVLQLHTDCKEGVTTRQKGLQAAEEMAFGAFLAAEADDKATLEVALAFIDACEGDDSIFSAGNSTASQVHAEAKQRRAKSKKKKRVRSAASSSTELQRRQKAETLRLRDQVAGLEEQLEQLIQMNGVLSCGFEADVIGAKAVEMAGNCDALGQRQKTRKTAMYEEAVAQFRGRQRAEKMNSKLKAILTNQVKVNGAFRGLLQKRSTLNVRVPFTIDVGLCEWMFYSDCVFLMLYTCTQGIDFVLRDQPLVERPLTDMDLSMAQLEQSVENLYLHAGSVFLSDELPSISSHMVVKQDPDRGKTVEMVTITPMACPIKAAGDLVWNQIKLTRNRGTRPNSLEKNYIFTLPTQDGVLAFKKLNYVRKFEESDRVVIVSSDLMLLPQYDVQFRAQSWLVISCSTAEPRNACVARSFLQLFAEPQGERSGGVANAQTTLFGMMGDSFLEYARSQQSMMIREAGKLTKTLLLMG